MKSSGYGPRNMNASMLSLPTTSPSHYPTPQSTTAHLPHLPQHLAHLPLQPPPNIPRPALPQPLLLLQHPHQPLLLHTINRIPRIPPTRRRSLDALIQIRDARVIYGFDTGVFERRFVARTGAAGERDGRGWWGLCSVWEVGVRGVGGVGIGGVAAGEGCDCCHCV